MEPGWPSRAAGVGRRAARVLFAGLVALAAAGCATSPATVPDRVYTGRFSAITTLAEKRESLSGRFSVEVRGHHQTIDLSTALGTTVARIEVRPDGARVSSAGMPEVRGTDADALTEQLLGWRLPVSGMSDWIEGRPAPGRPARVEREGSRPVLIEQDGWIVRLSETFEASGRPRLIVLERPPASPAPGVILRLIVDDPAA